MTLRVALRSMATRPVRSAVLACGFGFGIGVMAALLGIGEVILDQARSPALKGGGDVVVSGVSGRVDSARFVMSRIESSPTFRGRVAATSPTSTALLHLMQDGRAFPVRVRGGIPSLEKALGDPETAGIDGWTDAQRDSAWSSPDPADVLHAMDRFHPIPDVPARAESWAEWLYFNGSAGDVKLYLSFIVGPLEAPDRRNGVVRLQLRRGGRVTDYSERAEVSDAELLARAPNVRIGENDVHLDGLRYRIRLRLDEERARGGTSGSGRRARGRPDVAGELVLEAIPGGSVPPLSIRGAGGWVSGYVVPVLSGSLRGTLTVGGETLRFDDGRGYHDHNWGFWEGVTWQWGQVASGDLSFVWGRVLPPSDAADPDRVPGFLAVTSAEGPVGFSTDVRITEIDDPDAGRPRAIGVRGRSGSIDLDLRLEVEDAIRTPLGRTRFASEGREIEFLQMRGLCRASGRVGSRKIDFETSGAAETFRDPEESEDE